MNKNGFESPLSVGTRAELEEKKKWVEHIRKIFVHADSPDQTWENVSYYIVPKRDWDVEHCPLIPVDYSG